MTVPQEVKVGIVGVGPHFKEILLPAIISQDNISFSAFCDRDADLKEWVLARFPRAIVVDDITDSKFWDNIDCVVCCSWPKIHQAVLQQAVKLKKHCFCEKPAALDAIALDDVIGDGMPHDLVIRVGHVFRYAGGSSRFIKLLGEEKLMCLEMTYIGSGPRGKRWNLGSKKAFALTHLTHAVDFVTAIAGNVTKVKNALWSREGDSESITAIFKNERCPMTCLFATNAANAFTCKATAILEGGGLVTLDSLRSVTVTGLVTTSKRSGSVYQERDLGTTIINDGYVDEMRDFFSEIRGVGHCHLPDLVQARHVLSVIDETLK